MISLTRTNIKIEAKPERVVPLYFKISSENRIKRIVSQVLALDEKIVESSLNKILLEFDSRHIAFKQVLINNYNIIKEYIPSNIILSNSRKQLLGAYFTKEYSVESAALFNPSIVKHPSQDSLDKGEVRFILSLRATGEGHISSVEFRTGVISKTGEIAIDTPSSKLAIANKTKDQEYSRDFIIKRADFYDGFNTLVFDYLPERFNKQEALQIISDVASNNLENIDNTKDALCEIFDTNYDIFFDEDIAMSSKVIFPISGTEEMGIEDVRFVEFTDQQKTTYMGTYTAYDGKTIRSQIIETEDFTFFRIRSLYGTAIHDKGMALFPEKINGKFAMISRQGGENISIMYSEDIYFWNNSRLIQQPEKVWELTQMGNSGSPLKTPYGWLLLTHAVGPLRKYVLSATLLDLVNPEIVLSTLEKPLLSPNSDEREGYVPNVVYTCGAMLHAGNLIIPYAMSDSSSSFASVNMDSLMNELLKK